MTTLAIHPGALGDLLLFGHLLAAVGDDVVLVGPCERVKLLEHLGVVRRAVDMESLPLHELYCDRPLGECSLPAALERIVSPCESLRVISCMGHGDARIQARLLGATGAESTAFLPVRPETDFAGHLLDLWADLLGLSGSEDTWPARTRPWAVPAQSRRAAAETLRQAGVDAKRPYVVLHPGSGGLAKCWPLESYLQLAWSLLARRKPPQVLFALGPAELERWPQAPERIDAEGGAVLATPSLPVLAAVLAGSGAYVGNDSGVSHLAAGVGARCTVLFGPSNPAHFGPVGPHVTVIKYAPLAELPVESVLRELAPFVVKGRP